eukprot:2554715-Pyramimonas_sp.AAC.1
MRRGASPGISDTRRGLQMIQDTSSELNVSDERVIVQFWVQSGACCRKREKKALARGGRGSMHMAAYPKARKRITMCREDLPSPKNTPRGLTEEALIAFFS